MKRERAKRKLHMFWHKLIPPFCIEYNKNWKTKSENRAQVSVTLTKTRLTDTRKGHCSKNSGMSMEKPLTQFILPQEQGEPYSKHLGSRQGV